MICVFLILQRESWTMTLDMFLKEKMVQIQGNLQFPYKKPSSLD